MAISEDATGVQTLSQNSTSNTIPYTPTGTLAGVCLLIGQGVNSTDTITSVQYGGDDMTLIATHMSTGEAGGTMAYFLGSGVQQGAQNCVVTTSVGQSRIFALYGFNSSGGDIELVDSDVTIASTSIDDPQVTLSLTGRDCWCGLTLFSGRSTTPQVTVLADWVKDIEIAYGVSTGYCISYNTIGTTDVTAGVTTDNPDDAFMIAVALAEAASGSIIPQIMNNYRQRRA